MQKKKKKRKPAPPRRRKPHVVKSTLETGTSQGNDPLAGEIRPGPYERWGIPKD